MEKWTIKIKSGSYLKEEVIECDYIEEIIYNNNVIGINFYTTIDNEKYLDYTLHLYTAGTEVIKDGEVKYKSSC